VSIYFRNFPKNGTAKPGMSWAVMGYSAISMKNAGQRGGGVIFEQTILYLLKTEL
jgi:hypothetical protein